MVSFNPTGKDTVHDLSKVISLYPFNCIMQSLNKEIGCLSMCGVC